LSHGRDVVKETKFRRIRSTSAVSELPRRAHRPKYAGLHTWLRKAVFGNRQDLTYSAALPVRCRLEARAAAPSPESCRWGSGRFNQWWTST